MASDYWAFSRGEIGKAILYRLKVASIWNKLALAIVFGGIIFVVGAKSVVLPLSRVARTEYYLWRANSLEEQGQNEAAFRAYHQALRSGGNGNVRLLTALANFLSSQKSPELMAVLDRLAALEPKNFAVQYRQAALAMDLGRPIIALQILDRIPDEQRQDADYLAVAAALAFERRDYDQSIRLHREAAGKEPASSPVAFQVLEAEARGSDSRLRAGARKHLDVLAKRSDPSSAAALRILTDLAQEEGQPARAETYAARLATLPEAEVEDELRHLRIASGVRPSAVPEIINALMARGGHQPKDIEIITQGLIDQGRIAVADAWLAGMPESVAKTDEARRSLLLVRAMEGQWADVFERLEKGIPGYPVPKDMVATVRRAFAQYDRGNTEAERTWLQAVYMPEPDATTLNVLQFLAACRGWGRAQSMCLRRWTESYPDDLLAWSSRVKYESREGNLGGVCASLEAMRRIDPNDVVTNSRWVLATCLMRRDRVEDLLETAEKSYRAANPADPEIAVPYALALMSEKKNRRAAEVIERLSPSDRMAPRWAMFTGAVLAANRRLAEALPYLEQSEQSVLTFPEEEVFVRRWDDIARGAQDVDGQIEGMLNRSTDGERAAEEVRRTLVYEMQARRRGSALIRVELQRNLAESHAQRGPADAAKILASLREQVQLRSKTQKELRALLDSIRAPAGRDS